MGCQEEIPRRRPAINCATVNFLAESGGIEPISGTPKTASVSLPDPHLPDLLGVPMGPMGGGGPGIDPPSIPDQ